MQTREKSSETERKFPGHTETDFLQPVNGVQ